MLLGKEKQTGFTMMELLTVLFIIAVLAGVLIPSMNTVRKAARNARQKAQFAAIEIALLAFKTDDGDYPESELSAADDYGGAQKLAEAMVGWDLMGFHPDSTWEADGHEVDGGVYNASDSNNLDERRGYYLELSKANVYRLGHIDSDKPGLFKNYASLAGETFVICDSFGVRKLTMGKKAVRAGTPILYYRADPSKKDIDIGGGAVDVTYYNAHNYDLVDLGKVTSNGEPGDAHEDFDMMQDFYDFIRDETATAASGDIPRAYNPDSYILISAGADGEYGTADDITNFGD